MFRKLILTSVAILLLLATLPLGFSLQPPDARFTYSPAKPNPKETVTFNASESYDPDGYIVSYKWNFGDGTLPIIEADPITTHNYTTTGTYPVTLNITDNEGLWSTATKLIEVVKLRITVTTDKSEYNLGENIHVYGNLTLGSSFIPDGLVGLQINNAKNEYFIFRTLPTNTTTPSGYLVEILEVLPCDYAMNPKNIFRRDKSAYFKVTFRNNDNVPRNVSATINLCDVNNVPFFATILVTMEVSPGSTSWGFGEVLIPDSATLGTAKVYASLFDKLPEDGGVPYCPEKSATFTISATAGSSTAMITPTNGQVYSTSTDGTYDLFFKLPGTEGYRSPVGIYTIYTTSHYQERPTATNSSTFNVTLLGDINSDGIVNILDAIKLAAAFGSKPGSPNWNPKADINKDGVVNILDAIILAANFGKKTA